MQRLISKGSQGISIVPSAKALEKDTTSVADKTDTKNLSKDFLSILFEQIKTTAKKSTTEETLLHHDTSSMETTNSSNTSLKKPSKSSSELLLGEILNIISSLKENDTQVSFPKFTDTVQSILQKTEIANTSTLLNEVKNVKNVTDLIDLSKKYQLGLEHIKLTHEKVETLQKDFPKLDIKQFFELTNQTNQTEKKVALKTTTHTTTTQQTQHMTDTKKIEPTEKPLTRVSITTKQSQHIVQNHIKESVSSPLAQSLQILRDTSKPHVQITQQSLQETTSKSTKTPKNILQTLLRHSEDIKQPIAVSNHPKENMTTTKEHTAFMVFNKDHENTIKSHETVKISDYLKPSETSTPKQSSSTQNTQQNDHKTLTYASKNIQDIVKPSEATLSKIPAHDVQNKQKITQEAVVTKPPVDALLSQHVNSKPHITINTDMLNALALRTTQMSQTTSHTQTQDKKVEPLSGDKLGSVKIDIKNHIPQEISKTDKALPLRESFNQFASDLKEKMEHYKPPIMKLQLSLNPKNLGSVDVTLLHRGNNLHVNITSNTNTMALFTQNQTEFKNSLVSMGFSNLEMNFSDQGQSKHDQGKQGNKQQRSTFESIQNQSSHDGTLELIVPQYV
ncbi:flagellar hook-length control protein FliK [Sulfurospirillum sp. 1612]|uniref:flagellar hook-length control protein FliK n=1 Tax=Sulfurospirillum sp. 1612 TaxID=3094835 RepID=UPI002F934824